MRLCYILYSLFLMVVEIFIFREEKIKHELKTNCRIRLLITNIMPTSDETTEDETYTIHITLNELITIVFALQYFYIFFSFMRYNFKDKIENI